MRPASATLRPKVPLAAVGTHFVTDVNVDGFFRDGSKCLFLGQELTEQFAQPYCYQQSQYCKAGQDIHESARRPSFLASGILFKGLHIHEWLGLIGAASGFSRTPGEFRCSGRLFRSYRTPYAARHDRVILPWRDGLA